MKKGYLYILLSMALLGMACNKEWTDELYVNNVSFVKSGVVKAYVKYNSAGGIVPYKVPILVCGNTMNKNDIQVTMAIDKDTISNLNFDRFRMREDLYFHELSPDNYTFKSMSTTIPNGSEEGFFDLNLKLDGLDMYYNYILPLKLVSTSINGVNTRKYYSKSLMQIIPFTDYSGSYSDAGKVFNRDNNNATPLTTPTRTASVVNENTVFFYAGVVDETAYDRAKYKIYAKFNADGTVSLSAPNPSIKFKQNSGTYRIEKKKDDVLPYLERTYLIMTLDYWYSDITNPGVLLNYDYQGTLTLEKVRNTQIPDEDQQVIIQ